MKITILSLFLSLTIFAANDKIRDISYFGKVRYETHSTMIVDYMKLQPDERPKQFLQQKIIYDFQWFFDEKPKSIKELLKIAEELNKKGVKGPLFEAHYADALIKNQKFTEAKIICDKAIKSLNAKKYSSNVKRYVYSRKVILMRETIGSAGDRKVTDFHRQCLSIYQEYLENSTLKEYEWLRWDYTVYFYEHLDFNVKKEFYQKLSKSDKLSPWHKAMINGLYHRDLAWEIRGDGYANKVKEKGFEGFKINLKKAEKAYSKAWALKPEFPQSAKGMIGIAMASNTEVNIRTWFDRTIKAQIDHKEAYEHLTWAYRPRWGGSHRKMLDFARECAAMNRPDLYTAEHVLIIVLDIHKETKTLNFIKEQNFFPVLKNTINGIAKARPQYKAHFYSYLIAIAIRTGNYAEARTAIDQLGKLKIDPDPFTTFKIDPNFEIPYAFAIKGNTGLIAKQARQLYFKEELTKREVKELKQLVEDGEAISTDKRALPFYKFCKNKLKARSDFFKGDWVQLKFDKDLSQWVSIGGWSYVDENTVELLKLQQTASLTHRNRFTPPYVIEASIEHSKKRFGGRHLHMGLRLGNFTNGFDNYDQSTVNDPQGKLFWVDGYRKKCGIVSFGEDITHYQLNHIKLKNKITIVVFDGYYEFYVNDRLVEFNTTDKFVPSKTIALSSIEWIVGLHGKVTFSNIKLRHIKGQKFPSDGDRKSQINFYTDRIKFKPKSYLWFTQRARLHYNDKNYHSAIKDFVHAASLSTLQAYDLIFQGKSYARINSVEKAKHCLEKALKINGNIETRNLIAWTYSTVANEKIADGQKALMLIKPIMKNKKHANNPVYIDTYAAALARTGNFKEAVKQQKKAVSFLKGKHNEKEYKSRLILYEKNKAFFYK